VASRRSARLSTSTSRDAWTGTALDIYRSNYAGFLREARRILVPEGLLLTDLRALKFISERPMHPTSLAARLDLTPAAATQLLDRLERHRLVRRHPDPSDRRATVVRLTPEGQRAYHRTARRVRAFILEITGEMSPGGLDALRRGSEELARVLETRAAA